VQQCRAWAICKYQQQVLRPPLTKYRSTLLFLLLAFVCWQIEVSVKGALVLLLLGLLKGVISVSRCAMRKRVS
jgi:hypothetical protein